jgi:hypothetical protein
MVIDNPNILIAREECLSRSLDIKVHTKTLNTCYGMSNGHRMMYGSGVGV